MRTIVLCYAVFGCAISASAITIDTVPIGNVGNPNDPATGGVYGGVNYAYSIGKYEVTVGQYAAFLNAVAKTDNYSLWVPGMEAYPQLVGISRNGVAGNYSYSVTGVPSHPVMFIDWGDAARFANWIHNGQPMGPEDSSTTEDGAYTLNGATTDAALSVVQRNPGARWFIPSESEWYKAAYYQPAATGGDADSYWNYPMRTNAVPYSDEPPGNTPDNTRVGNFYKVDSVLFDGYDDGYAVTGYPDIDYTKSYLTDVGAYSFASSYYGTFDQGGNAWEWNEGSNPAIGPTRSARGGSWFTVANGLAATFWINPAPSTSEGQYGFRLATLAAVPEPSTIFLALPALAVLVTRRRKSVPHKRA